MTTSPFEADTSTLLDSVAGSILGLFIGNALGVSRHWRNDTEDQSSTTMQQQQRRPQHITTYADPDPGSFHSGSDDSPGRAKLRAGQLELQGEIAKLLLGSLAQKHAFHQSDFADRFENIILRDEQMDGTPQGGRYGWTDKYICDIYKARIKERKDWDACINPRNDSAEPIVRCALLGAAYFQTPKELCDQVLMHCRYSTGDSSVHNHAIAFACLVACSVHGLPLDETLSQRLYQMRGRPFPFSSLSSDHRARDGSMRLPEANALHWFGDIARVVHAASAAAGALPPHVGVCLYGSGDGFFSVVGSAYFCIARYPNDFGEAVLCSANGGGQSTARTSLVGAVLGAKVGLKGIPNHLVSGLDDHENIIAMAMQVARDALARRHDSDAWPWQDRQG